MSPARRRVSRRERFLEGVRTRMQSEIQALQAERDELKRKEAHAVETFISWEAKLQKAEAALAEKIEEGATLLRGREAEVKAWNVERAGLKLAATVAEAERDCAISHYEMLAHQVANAKDSVSWAAVAAVAGVGVLLLSGLFRRGKKAAETLSKPSTLGAALGAFPSVFASRTPGLETPASAPVVGGAS